MQVILTGRPVLAELMTGRHLAPEHVPEWHRLQSSAAPQAAVMSSEKNYHACRFVISSKERNNSTNPSWTYRIIILLALATLFGIHTYHFSSDSSQKLLEKNAWRDLAVHTNILNVAPIRRAEYINRQSKLSLALQEANLDAFIAEPSKSSEYYANVSANYELSERPFLLIFQADGGIAYLAPLFEMGRIHELEMIADNATIIAWTENESPYAALRSATNFTNVMLDEQARYMIAAGLQEAGFSVLAHSHDVKLIRAVKSEHEIEIMRAVNTFTWQLIRSVQRHLTLGLTQSAIVSTIASLNKRAGVPDSWSIVLFGADAANPHGGSKRIQGLERGEFVLIDTGTSLHGYGSDVTRTVLPDNIETTDFAMSMWHLVHDAQSAALRASQDKQICAGVDETARKVIEDAGWGEFFTHRLGHGLGLEMHEEPYLNGANKEVLTSGNVVTNEPGIYVTAQQALDRNLTGGFGIRIEDAVVITSQGAQILTGARACSPWQP